MNNRLPFAAGLVAVLALVSAPALAVPIAANTPTAYTVSSLTATGTSFTYSGTLTASDTLTLTTGPDTTGHLPCLQPSSTYCVNAAGVIVVAGSDPVGSSSQDSASGFTYGSLILEINGIFVEQIFPTNAANGLGSGSPAQSLTLPASTFASLGFASFSLTDPTITLIVDDTLRTDNVGGFSGSLTIAPAAVSVPEPGSVALLSLGAIGLALARRRRRT